MERIKNRQLVAKIKASGIAEVQEEDIPAVKAFCVGLGKARKQLNDPRCQWENCERGLCSDQMELIRHVKSCHITPLVPDPEVAV